MSDGQLIKLKTFWRKSPDPRPYHEHLQFLVYVSMRGILRTVFILENLRWYLLFYRHVYNLYGCRWFAKGEFIECRENTTLWVDVIYSRRSKHIFSHADDHNLLIYLSWRGWKNCISLNSYTRVITHNQWFYLDFYKWFTVKTASFFFNMPQPVNPLHIIHNGLLE